MTKAGDYMIYRLYNEETKDTHTEFFLPDDSIRRVLGRQLTLADLRDRGYKVIGILYVDKECYLNARLTRRVEEYIDLDNQEYDMKQRFNRGEVSYQVAIRTLEMIQDQKWTKLKQINMLVNRLISEDFNINNEVAIQLYDMYIKCTLG